MIPSERQVDLMLDSGAYSCWKRKEELHLGDYISYLHAHRDCFTVPVNLDTIPGDWGRRPTITEVEESARKSHESALTMRAAGLDIIPVYHMGERRYWLDRMIGDGFTYIGISPANDARTRGKMDWLDGVFGHLCGNRGFPAVRTHGFGVTAMRIMYRYPWYTADSITYRIIGCYGMIMVPHRADNGTYRFDDSPAYVTMSTQAGIKAYESGMHYSVMGETQRKWVRDYVDQEQFDLARLQTDYMYRVKMNCRFFLHMQEARSIKPFHLRTKGLFASKEASPHGATEAVGKFKMIFSQNTSKEDAAVLQSEGARSRLLSYFVLRGDKPAIEIREYVRTGLLPDRRVKKVEQDDRSEDDVTEALG